MNTIRLRQSHIFGTALAVILAVALALPAHAAKKSADELLSLAAAKIDNSPSVSVDFSILGAEGAIPCRITMAKASFVLESPQANVWYDGRTQWTYLHDSGEVSITEPTRSELMESNPFAIISYYSSRYKARRLRDEAGNPRIELTPEGGSPSGIRCAVLTLDGETWLPVAAEVTFSNGSSIHAVVNKATVGKAEPAETFKYDKNKFPANEIIDLR